MASMPIIIHAPPALRTATVSVSQRRVPPQNDNGVGTNEPRFLLFFDIQQHHAVRITGDFEAEYPCFDYRSAIMEFPIDALRGESSCANYLCSTLPWVHDILDVTYVDMIAQRIGIKACNIARYTNFSGFQLDATLQVSFSETVIVTMVSGGASESALERLTAESFYANRGETGQCHNCVICLGEFSGDQLLTRLPCSHVFHHSCVIQWLGRSNACPLCRRRVEDD